jgi:hypothetical protein
MGRSPLLFVLTGANMLLLAGLLVQACASARAGDDPSVLRGRSLELVDDQGRVRASIAVMPAGTSEGGVAYPETVLLRLITEKGRPSVKIAATEEGSGLSFAGPSGTSDTYVILEARGTSSMLKLRNEEGREHLARP